MTEKYVALVRHPAEDRHPIMGQGENVSSPAGEVKVSFLPAPGCKVANVKLESGRDPKPPPEPCGLIIMLQKCSVIC